MQKKQLKILNSKIDLTKYKFQNNKCNCIYISAPITTGPNFFEWYLKRGSLIEDSIEYKNAHYNEVIKPNLDKILRFHKDLSNKFNIPILKRVNNFLRDKISVKIYFTLNIVFFIGI